MILNLDNIKNMLDNPKMVDVYISHRVHGESFRSIAKRYNVDSSTIFANWVRACRHIQFELRRELERSEYALFRHRTANTPEGANMPLMMKKSLAVPSLVSASPQLLIRSFSLDVQAVDGIR